MKKMAQTSVISCVRRLGTALQPNPPRDRWRQRSRHLLRDRRRAWRAAPPNPHQVTRTAPLRLTRLHVGGRLHEPSRPRGLARPCGSTPDDRRQGPIPIRRGRLDSLRHPQLPRLPIWPQKIRHHQRGLHQPRDPLDSLSRSNSLWDLLRTCLGLLFPYPHELQGFRLG